MGGGGRGGGGGDPTHRVFLVLTQQGNASEPERVSSSGPAGHMHAVQSRQCSVRPGKSCRRSQLLRWAPVRCPLRDFAFSFSVARESCGLGASWRYGAKSGGVGVPRRRRREGSRWRLSIQTFPGDCQGVELRLRSDRRARSKMGVHRHGVEGQNGASRLKPSWRGAQRFVGSALLGLCEQYG